MEEDELASVLEEAKAFVAFLAETGLLDPASDDPEVLLDHLDRIEGRFRRNMADTSRYSFGKRFWLAAAAEGVQPDDEKAVQSLMEAFNARPLAEREAVLGRTPQVKPDRGTGSDGGMSSAANTDASCWSFVAVNGSDRLQEAGVAAADYPIEPGRQPSRALPQPDGQRPASRTHHRRHVALREQLLEPAGISLCIVVEERHDPTPLARPCCERQIGPDVPCSPGPRRRPIRK